MRAQIFTVKHIRRLRKRVELGTATIREMTEFHHAVAKREPPKPRSIPRLARPATMYHTGLLVESLREVIKQEGSAKAAAARLKISPGWLSRLLRGLELWPDDKLLKRLRLERKVLYWRKR
jgi:hypothetical protein